MKKSVSLFLAFALIFALSLSGCGGSRGSVSLSSQTTAETAAAADYDLGYNSINQEGMAEMAPTAAPVPIEAAVEEETSWEEDTASVPFARKLIRTMDLTVETTDFDPLIHALQTKVAEFKGYIEQSDISGNSITNQGRPSKKYAHMTLRIPADKLDSFISQVEAAGNITYKSENVSDVTLQYSDIQSRLKTLRMEQDRLWELLGKADTTEAIVLLEERLTEVSSEIESFESRMRYLDNSVTYSTVYLSINEVDIESPTQPETAWQQIQRGFTRNLIDLMDNLTQFIIAFFSHLPVILFLALLISALIWIIQRTKKHRNRTIKKSETPEKTKPNAVLPPSENPDDSTNKE